MKTINKNLKIITTLLIFFCLFRFEETKSQPQMGVYNNIARGANSSEIFLTTFWYFSDNISWEGVFHSLDNGETITLQHKYATDLSLNTENIYGDSEQGTIYIFRHLYQDTLMVSHDYGVNFENKKIQDDGSNAFASGCVNGEFYLGSGSAPAFPILGLKRYRNFGDSMQMMNNNFSSLALMDVGTQPGEVYAIKYPYVYNPIGIGFSQDSGQNFSVFYQDTILLDNLSRYTWSRGVNPGELYIAGYNAFSYTWHIFYSSNYGQSLVLKQITDSIPPAYFVSFTAGRTPGSFYMMVVDCCSCGSDHAHLWIYHSQDYGETFTTYFHDLDPLLIGINRPFINDFVTIRPNPGTDHLIIESGPQVKGDRFILTDLSGDNVMDLPINAPLVRVDVKSIPCGCYVWQLFRKNKIIDTGKWIKQR